MTAAAIATTATVEAAIGTRKWYPGWQIAKRPPRLEQQGPPSEAVVRRGMT
jgi:hypothetical protein